MSLKGSMPVRFHDTAASCCMALAEARTSERGGENALRGPRGNSQVRGSSTAMSAHDNFAWDDSARQATEAGYRFFVEFRVGTSMGLLTGTIAPFDGSAAALALMSTSS